MSTLQAKHVAPALHRRIKKAAAKSKQSMSDLILEAIERELQRREFFERLARRQTSKLSVSGAQLLEEARGERG